MAVTFTPISDDIGAEVTGLAGADLVDPDVAEALRAAIDDHVVVVVRECHISDDDLVALSRLLGDVVVRQRGGLDSHPEVETISLDPAESALAAYQRGTFYWHIDGSTDLVPQQATLLSAVEVASEGGDTEFANLFAAYEALPDDDKALVADLQVVHSFTAAQLLLHPDPSDKMRAAWAQVPARTHPLVWTRTNGRRSLLLGATAGEIVGWSPADGRGLLDRLLAFATQPRFVLRHRWHRGDLVIWDNTGALHRAEPYAADSHRLMHRTTLAGREAVV